MYQAKINFLSGNFIELVSIDNGKKIENLTTNHYQDWQMPKTYLKLNFQQSFHSKYKKQNIKLKKIPRLDPHYKNKSP